MNFTIVGDGWQLEAESDGHTVKIKGRSCDSLTEFMDTVTSENKRGKHIDRIVSLLNSNVVKVKAARGKNGITLTVDGVTTEFTLGN